MAENQQKNPQPGTSSLPSPLHGLHGVEAGALRHRIKASICKSVQSKVDNILQDVEKFTDIEKLYLYLKLPSGPSNGSDKCEQTTLSSSRTQQTQAFSWIQNHLEEHPDTSLPKQEVYDEYKSYCDNLGYHPLSAADFGKIMKNVFPNMKARRLGMRGKSKYCYSGLRKKALVHVPSLPNLDVHKTNDGCEVLESSGVPSCAEDEVRLAACGLVCEWAQKVLSQSFDCVEDLARYLLNSQYISTKSMAALTLITGTSTGGMKTSVESCPFVPLDDSRSFQPQAKPLPSPTVDAKQQLQRKIQKKQQERKLHSPLLGDGQTPTPTQARRPEAGIPCMGPSISCGSPALLSPQPTIGIVVAAVPSPITGSRTKQLTSPSPMGAAENKVVPMNFQVVSQPMQPVKQTAKASPSVPASPGCERVPSRSRYPQILPKPSAPSALTLRSPPTLLITNSPIKTVVPTSHVVKMTAISLPASSSTGGTTLRPVLTGVTGTGLAEEQRQPLQTHNCSQQSPSQSPVATKSACLPAAATSSASVKMEPEAITDDNRTSIAERLNTTQEAAGDPKGVRGAKRRAASEPTPYCKGALGPDGAGRTTCGEKFPFGADTAAASAGSNTNSNKSENALYLTIPSQNTTIALSSHPNTTATSPKESSLGSGSLRKRSGAGLESVPVKKVFITQHPVSGAQSPSDASETAPQSGTPARPESAPATTTCKVTVKLNSTVPTRILARSDSPLGNPSIFRTVAKLQASPQLRGEGLPSKSEDGGLTPRTFASTSSQALLKEIASSSSAMQTSLALTDTSIMDELKNPIWEEGRLGCLQQQAFVHQMLDHRSVSTPVMDQLPMEPQAPPSNELTLHPDVEFTGSQPSVDYFPFNDDDMTQDSIVEELVQMEEQMKLNSLRSYGSCVDVSLQSQSAAGPGPVLSVHQTDVAFYHSLCSSTTPTLTPTPTPTSEMMAAGPGLTRESPCTRLAPATPVDGVLGSNRLTPVGTPHSNCSSSVPPSPVDSCRNPFAFTPINSSITGYHNASIVSSSPLKPMQRPTATHPDKAKLEWINNGYNSDGGSSAISNNGISILPNYQNLVEDQFRKPHAFAIPGQSHQSQARHDTNFGRLTPVSPVQQQATVVTNKVKEEGFAVPAPLDNKVVVSSAGGTFRCRSVSPAVRQRNLSGSTVHTSIPGSTLSQFNSPVTPEVLNIFANSCPSMDSSNMAQRSQSVPLNVMMQTEMLPVQTTNNSTKITSVLLSKMDPDGDDAVRGLGVNNMPSNYTARMNLTQILETTSTFQGGAGHQSLLNTNANHNPSQFQKPSYLVKNARNEQMSLYSRGSQAQVSPEEQQPELQQGQPVQNEQTQLEATSESQQPLDFDSTVKDLLGDDALNPGSQLTGQMVSELTSVASDFSSDIRLTSELSSSINDLDTNLLFDPSQQQGQYEDSTLEELKNDPLFQQICTENSVNFDWLESKDQHTVEMLG